MRFRRTFVTLMAPNLIFNLAGCAATQNVSNPSNITLEHALVDTVDALNAARAESIKKDTHFGFYGCSVTAVFNVSATAGQDNKLSLSASGPPVSILPVTIGGAASTESTASGTRANTVTVVLGTKYCLPNVKATSIKTPSGPIIKSSPLTK